MNFVDQQENSQFIRSVYAFIDGNIDQERFTALRLQHGIYGQRQKDQYMVRIKIPGGILALNQIRAIADVLQNYSGVTFANITTRQDIQLHFIPLHHVPATLERLASAGLTTREACGNTVRNVTACALAGVCPNEHTDVRTMVERVTRQFMRHSLTQHLPRKFKISISGCETDCAQGAMHDLAAITILANGRYGFKLLAGGGLGHKPRQAIVLADWLSEFEVVPAIEAVIALHHRHSDRNKRAKSRLKFLVERFGESTFKQMFEEEFSRTRAANNRENISPLRWYGRARSSTQVNGVPRHVIPQRQTDRVVIPLVLSLGDINAKQLQGLADVMDNEGLTEVRTTQDQNLLLTQVSLSRLASVRNQLLEVDLHETKPGDDVVACPGTWTCRLGITASREMAKQLTGFDFDLRVRVSGCHNGCAQPYVGDVGLYGEAKRVDGRLIPHYQLQFGGDGRHGNAYAVSGPAIPVARVQEALKRVAKTYRRESENGADSFYQWAQSRPSNYFDDMLLDLTQFDERSLSSVRRDFGDANDFRVYQFGGGECAGIAEESVSAAIAEARYERDYCATFILQQKWSEALECARSSTNRALYAWVVSQRRKVAFDVKQLYEAVARSDSDLAAEYQNIIDDITQCIDVPSAMTLGPILARVDDWINKIQTRLDMKLPGDNGKKLDSRVIDLRHQAAPYGFLNARLELQRLEPGSQVTLRTRIDDAHLLKSGLEAIGYIATAMESDSQNDCAIELRLPARPSSAVEPAN